ncbi:MAG: hypothetical protein WDN69_00395 [Aliidongia sp.]
MVSTWHPDCRHFRTIAISAFTSSLAYTKWIANHWERKLSLATLVIGDIKDTGKTFFDRYNPAPVACVFHDLDFYSSTSDALTLFDADAKHFSAASVHVF